MVVYLLCHCGKLRFVGIRIGGLWLNSTTVSILASRLTVVLVAHKTHQSGSRCPHDFVAVKSSANIIRLLQ